MKYNFTPTQDWNYYFSKIFENEKILNMIEFGLGIGTPYLADNCKYLKSVELSLGSYNLEWYEKTVDLMKNYKNWESEYIIVNEKVSNANDRAQKLKFPLLDTKYLEDLEKIFNLSLKGLEYDFIFIDPGVHTRGDLVNMSFGKADIIAAHDTSRDHNRVLQNVYGYNIVNVPENYVEIYYDCTYMGTTLWIEESKKDLIEKMKIFKATSI